MDQTYGRNRQSIADLEQELYDMFVEHPKATLNESQEPVIPGDALVDIFRAFSRHHDSVELLTKEEEDQLKTLIESNPGLAVTPQVLLQFIAVKSTLSPKHSPEHSPPATFSDLQERGRDDQHVPYRSHSRSSSRSSGGTSVYRPPSRPPSRGPPVPKTPTVGDSPFDRRMRSTPLQNAAAPSSWTRRPPPSRRKSDAGAPGRALSDTESTSSPPISFSHSYGGRTRTPSNPPSPTMASSPPTFSSFSRPHSRTASQPQSHFDYARSEGGDYTSPGHMNDRDYDQTIQGFGGLMSPPSSSDSSFEYDDADAQFASRISSLPQRPSSPSAHSDSSLSDEEIENSLGRILDHRPSIASLISTISMEDQEKIEALEKSNKDMARKLMEAERTLQNRMVQHESELADMESRLEEVRSELSATKREEKELRGKERTLQNQISSAEAEIAKMQKQLDNAKAAYQHLQKQYTEQLSESERTRIQLRLRDDDLKHAKENSDLQALELQKWSVTQASYESEIQDLQDELNAAQTINAELDEQKHENLMLKETIDRMRFDMDEMRTNLVSGQSQGGGVRSVKGSVSKSLGAELANKMKEMGTEWGLDAGDEDAEDEERTRQLLLEDAGGDTEGEDVIETIITRTKRKVASRAKRIESVNVDELTEYSDASIQCKIFDGVSSSAQTDPPPKVLVASSSMQTDPPPLSLQAEIQTDPLPEPTPPPHTVSIEIQTDEPEFEEEAEASTSGTSMSEEDETLASSSSTILPPTPKSSLTHDHQDIHAHDLPPAYDQAREDLALRIANETLKTWHKGLHFPVQPIEGGVSDDAVEDWKALKEELGVECMAIDKLIEESGHSARPRVSAASTGAGVGGGKHRRSRFYNIYNTYVYGDRSGSPSSPHTNSRLTSSQFLFCIGASAAVAFLVGHAMAPPYAVPGGATYYDRAAWDSFNSVRVGGEGFPGDGGAATAALWGFIGRLGGGAARTLRGWPT